MEDEDRGRRERDEELKRLTKELAESKILVSRILEIHGLDPNEYCDPHEFDARLKWLEERRRGPAPN